MRQRVRITLAAAILALLASGVSALFAAGKETAPALHSVTTTDPEIPVDELALLLKPLTKVELLAEAEAWQALLKRKAEEIAKAEIAVKRQNKEIEKAEEIQGKAEQAKEQLEKVKQKTEETKATGDSEQIQETQAAALEAHEKVLEVSAAVEEAAAAAEKTAEIKGQLDVETRMRLDETPAGANEAAEALGRVQDVAKNVDTGSSKSVRKAAPNAREATHDTEKATQEVQEKTGEFTGAVVGATEKEQMIERTAETLEQAKKQEKVEVLQNVNQLRTERTLISDHLEAVLAGLETKTDKEDTDTLAKIRDYRLYINSVSGISLDVEDTTSAWVAIQGWLTSDEGGLRWAKNFAVFISILMAAWVMSKILSKAMHRGLRMTGRLTHLLEDFLVGAVRWIVMAIGIIMALAALEVSVGPLLAVVGAAGFVVAFALQDSLSNFASGLMILFFRPFDVGDVVDAGGVSGKVISLNLVSTTIKTFDNKAMVVPNNKIWNGVITNATAAKTRRVDMEFGIGYDDNIDRVQTVLEEIVAAHPKVLKDPAPTIRMNTLADSSVNFICRPWAKNADYWDVYWDVTKAVKQRFDAEGIGIPFPQRDVHLYMEGGAGQEKLVGVLKGKPGYSGANPQPLELSDIREPSSDR